MGKFARQANAAARGVWRSEHLYAARIALIVAIAYFVGASIGLAFGFPATQISVIWPPNIVLIVAMLFTPRHLWWVVIAAGLPAEIVGFGFAGALAFVSVLYYASNAGQALLTVLLLKRFCGGAPRLDHFSSTAWFMVIAALVAPAVMSFLLAAILVTIGWIEDGWVFWQARFLTDALSTLTLIPLALVTLKLDVSNIKRIRPTRYLEAGLLVICLVIIGGLTFGNQFSQATNLLIVLFAPIPLFLWAGLRFGVAGVSLAMLMTAVSSLWNASYGLGPFMAQSPADSVLKLQLFIIEVGVPLILMAALLDERRASISALRTSNEQIHKLASKLIAAQEEERRRVARELHDEVGQALTTIKISLDTVRLTQNEPAASALPALPDLLDESVARVDHALEQVRNLSLLLRPSMLDDLGLVPALRWLANNQAEHAGYRVIFTADSLTPRPPPNVETVCYRVAQEALTNIARHAQASSVFIRLQVADAQLRMTIRDDGVGFDVGEMRQRSAAGSSMGVLGMEERAILAGGALTIQSLPGRGTTLELRLPYIASPEPDADTSDTSSEARFKSGQPSRQRDGNDDDVGAAAAPALLKTKFHVPRANHRWLARPRLLHLMGRNGSARIVLIIAAAGFGKTTLIGQWLAQHDEATSRKRAVAWLSLEASDNSPERFFGYLIAAMCDAVPMACAGVKDLTSGAHFPPLNVVTDALLDDLAALPGPLAIVLDDYHAITDDRIHAAMARILDHLPAGVDAVITSREAPLWPLGRMRAAGRVVEVNADELAFTLDEARALLGAQAERAGGLTETVHRRTEGWPLGLQLARISLHDQPRSAAGVNESSSADHYTVSYLFEEVLTRQPQAIQDFLLASALPNQFCLSLCDALRDKDRWVQSSEDALAWLEQRNLFLVPLDDEGTWYRYHHLFRDALLQQLHRVRSVGEVERLHLAASEWFQVRGLREEAVRHALLANQPVRAARIVERNAHQLIESTLAFAPAVQSLLSSVPSDMLHTRPVLLAIQAFLAYSTSDMAAMTDFVVRADRVMAQPPGDMSEEDVQTARDHLNWLRGITLFMGGDLAGSLDSSRRALESLPVTFRFERAMALTFETVVRALLGEVHQARQLLSEAMAKESDPSSDCANVLIAAACRLEIHTGNLDRALRFAAQLTEAHPDKGRYWFALGHNVQGRILHDLWGLDAASKHHEYVIGNRYGIGHRSIQDSLAGLAWIRLAQGDPAKAWAWAREAKAFACEVNDGYMQELTASLEIGLSLWQGDRDTAMCQMNAIQQQSNIGASLWRMEPRLRRAQLLIAQAAPQSVAEAVADLQVCLRDAERANNTYQAIEVRGLLALGFAALGNTDVALTTLKQAVEAATPQGIIRPFVDLGPPMPALLAQLAASTHISAHTHTEVRLHIGRIQAAFSGASTPVAGRP
jgi:LuxR family maltose regulon positive regulatory protein